MANRSITPINIFFKDQSHDDWSYVIHTYYPDVFKVGDEIFIEGDIYTIILIQLDIKSSDLSIEITLRFG